MRDQPAEGATHLSNLLARELEGAGDNWHRESIQQALADVQAFLEGSWASRRRAVGRGTASSPPRADGPLMPTRAGP